jgi:ribosomal protein S18 acetylase RimI-like enzyme
MFKEQITHPNRKLLDIRPFQQMDEDSVIELWKVCGLIVPWNNPQRDIQRKLLVQPELFLVGCFENHIVASAMAGYEGHRGWINYLAVDPNYQRSGFATQIMDRAETLLAAAGCPKICLQVRSENTAVIEFYRKYGYEIDDVVGLGKRLESDE